MTGSPGRTQGRSEKWERSASQLGKPGALDVRTRKKKHGQKDGVDRETRVG